MNVGQNRPRGSLSLSFFSSSPLDEQERDRYGEDDALALREGTYTYARTRA